MANSPINRVLEAPRKSTGSLIVVQVPSIPSLPFGIPSLSLNLTRTILLKAGVKLTTVCCSPSTPSSMSVAKGSQINLFHRREWGDDEDANGREERSVYDEIVGALPAAAAAAESTRAVIVDDFLSFVDCHDGDVKRSLRTLQR